MKTTKVGSRIRVCITGARMKNVGTFPAKLDPVVYTVQRMAGKSPIIEIGWTPWPVGSWVRVP